MCAKVHWPGQSSVMMMTALSPFLQWNSFSFETTRAWDYCQFHRSVQMEKWTQTHTCLVDESSWIGIIIVIALSPQHVATFQFLNELLVAASSFTIYQCILDLIFSRSSISLSQTFHMFILCRGAQSKHVTSHVFQCASHLCASSQSRNGAAMRK